MKLLINFKTLLLKAVVDGEEAVINPEEEGEEVEETAISRGLCPGCFDIKRPMPGFDLIARGMLLWTAW